MTEPFTYNLFDEYGDDDAEELAYKNILNDLIARRITPYQSAEALDAWVTGEANLKYDQVKQQQKIPSGHPTFEEDGLSPQLVGPNPFRHICMVNHSLTEICSAFPPGHPTQDSLVELIRELRDMPKHDVPAGDYHTDRKNPTYDKTFTLWPLGTPDTTTLGEQFRREADKLGYPFSDVEVLGSETQLRWRNLQSFAARLTVSNLIDCSRATSLSYLLPDAVAYPDLRDRRIGGPRRLTADLIGASFWLEEEQARQWVHRRCMEIDGTGEDERFKTWSRKNWSMWKEQFGFIAGLDACSKETRQLARSLREKMDAEG